MDKAKEAPSSEYGAAVPKEKGGDEQDSSEKNEYYHYDEKGTLVYTHPETKQEYVLNKAGSEWITKEEADKVKEKDGDGKAEEAEDKPEYKYNGSTYEYTDKDGKVHVWDADKNQWKAKTTEEEGEKGEAKKAAASSSSSESELDEDLTEEQKKEKRYRKRKAQPGWGGGQAQHYTDPATGAQLYRDASDGMVYEWDADKKAWFPRIDEDFMAQYQMNYGFTADGRAEPTRPKEEDEENKEDEEVARKRAKVEEQAKRAAAKPTWFQEDEEKSTKVYVSGLPATATEAKLLEFMSKCGMVEVDVRADRPKLKLYRDADGDPKGDALCTYVKVESVALALQILDGAQFEGSVVKVERAKFQMKGDKYNPKLKPKKLRKKELETLKRKHEKMFAWEPDKLRGVQENRSKRDKVIVIRNLFEPSFFDADAALILEYSSNLREQCSKFGTVRRVVVYDKHPEGVAQVFFSTPAEADQAISMMDGRLFFNKRVMGVTTWDGKTKFQVDETEEEERKRLENWDKFLEEEEEQEEGGGGGDGEKDAAAPSSSSNSEKEESPVIQGH